jgi:tetratricopeptide (TPR) repeat protein
MRPLTRLALSGVALAAVAGAAVPAGAQGVRGTGDRNRYQTCVAEVQRDPARAVDTAGKWRDSGGGLPARHCLALALIAGEHYAQAAAVLEQAATVAQAANDPSAGDLWGQAGNAALLAGDTARAERSLSAGATLAKERPPLLGQLLIDRARARVEAGRMTDARADLDEAVKLLPQEPAGWLLRGTLARRTGDIAGARNDIAAAARLAPANPDVLLEQGNLAVLAGDNGDARRFWEQAATSGGDSPAAELARRALAENGIVEAPAAPGGAPARKAP